MLADVNHIPLVRGSAKAGVIKKKQQDRRDIKKVQPRRRSGHLEDQGAEKGRGSSISRYA